MTHDPRTFASLLKDLTAADVHVPSAGSSGKKPKNRKPDGDGDEAPFTFTAEIAKTDDEHQVVYGWASVIEDAGKVVEDHQHDCVTAQELIKAAHDYMLHSREGGDLHTIMGVGKIVDSIVLTADVQKALGINLGKIGWFIGMKVTDAGVWKRVKSGELRAFSIGGRAIRVPTT